MQPREIDLLGEYYDTVGDAVAEVDGTIKDFAGDGILVLVGAPLTRTDHAAAGLVLASLMLEGGSRSAASGRPGGASTPRWVRP